MAYLPAGGVTLLTGQWKAGKSTLLAALLGRMKPGGTLAERSVAACRKGRRGSPFRYALPGRALSDDLPPLAPLTELGITEKELLKIELEQLQKVLRRRRQEAGDG